MLCLSPHHTDMIAVATIYRDLMDGDTNVGEADGKLAELSGDVPFSNGFFFENYVRFPCRFPFAKLFGFPFKKN